MTSFRRPLVLGGLGLAAFVFALAAGTGGIAAQEPTPTLTPTPPPAGETRAEANRRVLGALGPDRKIEVTPGVFAFRVPRLHVWGVFDVLVWDFATDSHLLLDAAGYELRRDITHPEGGRRLEEVLRDPVLLERALTIHRAEGWVLGGTRPPAAGGFGLFVFRGGPSTDLVTAAGCPVATAAFWVTSADGDFVVFVPGSAVQTVNEAWRAMFPHELLPATIPVLGRCR